MAISNGAFALVSLEDGTAADWNRLGTSASLLGGECNIPPRRVVPSPRLEVMETWISLKSLSFPCP